MAAMACLVAAGLPAGAAHAQQLVYDPSAYGKLLQQAQTGLQQLEQLKSQLDQSKQLYDSLNRGTGVNSLASILSSPALRAVLPGADAFAAAAKGDLAPLGAIGAKAAQIRSANRAYTPPADDPRGQALESSGNRAARDLALGDAVADAGAQRLAGLQQLQGAIDAAPTARAVMGIQARLSAEQAMIANDQMRLQGFSISQAAEDRLARQGEQERAAADAAARLKLYRSGFQ
jgi:type IV secretion system protein VirB5